MPKVSKKILFGTGAAKDVIDVRDRVYDGIAFGAAPFDWNTGYDIEKIINHTIPIKNQNNSKSCVGQGWSYELGVLDAVETGTYKDVSAKAIYSQIALPQGGAYIRDGAKLAVDWGAVGENIVSSYDNGNAPGENFMKDKSWKDAQDDLIAQKLKSKEFRMVQDITIDIIAQGIRDNYGVVGGVMGANNGSWNTLEPTPGSQDWGHCLFFGKARVDDKGKYIATPNSWGDRFGGQWQKLRENWFTNGLMFNPWLLVDQVNAMSSEILALISQCDKGLIIENEAPGRKGIIYGGKMLEVTSAREGAAAIYLLETKGIIKRVSKTVFNQIPKGNSF